MRQRHQLQGNVLLMLSMDADTGGIEVGDGSSRTAVDEFHGDGVRVGYGPQVVRLQNGGIQESARRARIDERREGDGGLARYEKVNLKGEVTGSRERERGGKGKHATQPGPYWLGREFPGRVSDGRGAGGWAGSGWLGGSSGAGSWCQAPG